MQKNQLLQQLEVAEGKNDFSRVDEIRQELEQLEGRAEQLDKQRSKGLSAISYINEHNRKWNVLEAEKALAEEMAQESDKPDPFTRMSSRPMLVTKALESKVLSELLAQLAKAKEEKDDAAVASLTAAAAASATEGDTDAVGQVSALDVSRVLFFFSGLVNSRRVVFWPLVRSRVSSIFFSRFSL